MRLNDELLERAEEFFDLIAVDGDTTELDVAIDSLRRLLEDDVDGWTCHSRDGLARAVQERIEEIWSLIPAAAKRSNFNLSDSFDEFMEFLEEASGYEADEEDEIYFDEEEEEDECDDYSNEYDEE